MSGHAGLAGMLGWLAAWEGKQGVRAGRMDFGLLAMAVWAVIWGLNTELGLGMDVSTILVYIRVRGPVA